jgi:hypothetical protein
MKTHGEIDPSTEMRETDFHEQVRDILGLDPFTRQEAIFKELRRLKANDAIVDQLPIGQLELLTNRGVK